jgi:cell division septation protein DedD
MVWALSLSVLMFGLGFLAGSRWAEQKASESERVVVGRLVPPQVEIIPPEGEGESPGGQDGRVWNILTGQENPSSVLPPLSAGKEGRESASQARAQAQPPRGPGTTPPVRSAQESQGQVPAPPAQGGQSPAASQLGGTRYALQVVSVQTREKAEAIVRELNGKGYPLVRITSAELPGRGTWHRVWVGSFERKEEAEALRRQVLERERLQAQIVVDRR